MSAFLRFSALCLLIFSLILPVAADGEETQSSEPLKESNGDISGEIFYPQNTLEIDPETVIDLVQKQNLDIAIADTQIEQAKGYYFGSYAGVLPSVSFQFGAERFEGGEVIFGARPVDLDRTTYRPSIVGDYQIQTGGKPIFQILESKSRLNRLRWAHNRVVQAVLQDALTNYFVWLRDTSSIKASKQSLEEAEEQLNVAQLRLKTGFANKLEVMQAETLRAERKNLVLKAQRESKSSEANLAATLNLDIGVELKPYADEIRPLNLWTGEEKTISELWELASETRPDIRELNYSLKEAKMRHRAAIADLAPTIGLTGFVRGIGPKLDELQSTRQGALNINVNLLRNMGVGVVGNIKATKAVIREAILNKEKQLNQISADLTKAYYDVSLYRQQIEVAEQKIASTSEAKRIAEARLRTGVGIYLDLIHAETELLEARLEYQLAAMNYNNSQIALLYQLGLLTPKKVISSFY